MKKPTLFGKYFLLERINTGGMAEVFRAKAFGVEGFERLVAVKRILPNIAEDAEFIRMFIEEAKLSVQLTHANIAQIFDLGVVDGAYYIALEHVHGRDLRGIFDRCRGLGEAMPVAQACFVAMKVCEGLDYAHNKREQGRELSLVHRDVSPQNILVSFEGEVKLIDFGVAKAASNGTPTQAGILKGKFGYMSPEQVRGLPVDRRSDVFSCGIVLYELLTGERLFVGESDFSTLEKVRNVEILPPSTYNRKIPDELERIVLKALAKDVDDRYQNAIDLHDELQAFVYTAGEFYSRKDLAGWMKKTFVREIEEETARLESFRELKPPAPGSAQASDAVPTITSRSSITKSSGTRKPTQSVPIVRPPPPPPAIARSQPVPIAQVAISASAPVASPLSAPLVLSPVAPASAVPPPIGRQGSRPHRPAASSWDDDDLETRVFDDDDARHKSNRANLPLQAPPVSSSPAIALAAAEPARQLSQPHQVAQAAYAPPPPPQAAYAPQAPPMPPPYPLPQPPVLPAPPEHLSTQEASMQWDGDVSSSPTMGQATIKGAGGFPNGAAVAPAAFPGGSSNAPSPLAQPDARGESRPNPRTRGESGGVPISREPSVSRELSAPSRLVAVPHAAPVVASAAIEHTAIPEETFDAPSQPLHHPVTQFIERFAARKVSDRRRSLLVLAIGSAVIATISIIFAILLSGGAKHPAPAPGSAGSATAAPAVKPPPPIAADPSTGFDLYVSPAGIAQWKLDGELRTDRLPSRIRGIAPGPHTVQIEPPPGFMSQNQQVAVEQGKAPKVEITLSPITGITGIFESTPPGVSVSLIIDGKRQPLGATPARAPLDPRSTYQVLFEKPGYVSVNRPIVFSGGLEEHIIVSLEKDELSPDKAAVPDKVPAVPDKVPAVPDKPPVRTPAPAPTSQPAPHRTSSSSASGKTQPEQADVPDASDAKAQGVLVLGSKPPCEIAIDGSSTGLHTPQKDIKLSVGRHRVTLTNNEFSIKETFTVDIKADAPEKLIKDYSDRLPE